MRLRGRKGTISEASHVIELNERFEIKASYMTKSSISYATDSLLVHDDNENEIEIEVMGVVVMTFPHSGSMEIERPREFEVLEELPAGERIRIKRGNDEFTVILNHECSYDMIDEQEIGTGFLDYKLYITYQLKRAGHLIDYKKMI
jgi:hypothetical protein